MTRYRKLFTALLAAALASLVAQVIGGHITQIGLINVGLAVVAAGAVYYSAEVPGLSPYAKAIMAGLFAGAALLNTLIGAGSLTAVTASEWSQVGIAVLFAAAQIFVKNEPAAAIAAKVPAP